MKKLAILTGLISSSTYANQLPFDQPDFLKLANDDPAAARDLSIFCSATRRSLTDCKDIFSGDSNLKQEAARKCVQKMNAAAASFNFPASTVSPGSISNEVSGQWPSTYHTDENGIHRHAYTEKDRQRAVYQYELILTRIESDRQKQKNGDSSKSGTKEVNKSAGWGIDLGKLGSSFTTKENEIKTETPGLSAEALARIKEMAKDAYDKPSLGQVIPSILCFFHQKDCTVDGGQTIPNTSYEPEKKKDESKKEEPKKPDAPKHAEESSKEPPHMVHVDTHGDSWAGADKPSGGTMIATPAEQDLGAKSAMEICLDVEFKELIDTIGTKTKDPGAEGSEKFRKHRAEDFLKTGYCEESYFGKEYCQAFNNNLHSVPVIGLPADKIENVEAALKDLNETGICDSANLGWEFCIKHKFKLDSVPFDHGLYSGKSGLSETNSPSSLEFNGPEFDGNEFNGPLINPGEFVFKSDSKTGSKHVLPRDE